MKSRVVDVRPSLMANLILAIVKEVAAGFRQAQTVGTPLQSAVALYPCSIGGLRRRLRCLVYVQGELENVSVPRMESIVQRRNAGVVMSSKVD